MTDQTPEYYRPVSEHLHNILDNVGYSCDVRDRKIMFATEYEMFWNMEMALAEPVKRFYIYVLGSRGESSTGPGLESDTDILFHSDPYQGVTGLNECQPDMINLLMVKDTSTHPGYVKLQLIRVSPNYAPVLIYGVEPVDSLNRSIMLNKLSQNFGLLSGPAIHCPGFNKMYSTDNVYAIKCSRWPQEGYEWFQRRRLHGWPSPKQIQNAWKYGCFATPVGHPYSSEVHQEWRLSFSITERYLVRSFEDTVMKVYILLKMIRKTYIEPVVGDAFSSYHCKVCMLWMREQTPRELWSKANILYCLTRCIRQLYEWATTGFCPDYFIVTNNIYDRKIVGTVRFDLIQTLDYLLSTDCRFLLGVECCYLGQLLSYSVIGQHIHLTPNMWPIGEEINFDYKFCLHQAIQFRHCALVNIPECYSSLVDYLERFLLVSKHMPYRMLYAPKYAMMVLSSQLGFHIVSFCKEHLCGLSRGQIDYLVQLVTSCLSLGINSDATSVRLKLCGLGMELGNHNLTERCLQHISDYQMCYMYSATVGMKRNLTILNRNLTWCLERINITIYSIEELLQTQVSFSVVYTKSEISITPAPLRMEMFRSVGSPQHLREPTELPDEYKYWHDWCVVDSLMCLYFFQYINFSKQRKERHRQVAMDNMINVIRTESNILHKDTALNLLGYSFMKEDRLFNAFVCFTESLKIRPYHNAARFHLALLFQRTLTSHRRHAHYGSVAADIAG
ncbi:hypothetical protein ACJMK2_018341 [Sinanodonta woodiana]|uniref:Mab-21-like HhH/H2TH-like domain-containing protein n=1 Tax=Sinanodonta woodiana TaxID=1069815 RepID=A0ABD3UGR4_SINWO